MCIFLHFLLQAKANIEKKKSSWVTEIEMNENSSRVKTLLLVGGGGLGSVFGNGSGSRDFSSLPLEELVL